MSNRGGNTTKATLPHSAFYYNGNSRVRSLPHDQERHNYIKQQYARCFPRFEATPQPVVVQAAYIQETNTTTCSGLHKKVLD